MTQEVRYRNHIKWTPVVWNYEEMLKYLHIYMRYLVSKTMYI